MKWLVVLLLFVSFNINDFPVPVVNHFHIKELRCLELNLHYEARGESISGIKAVAHVTVNRTKSGKFPSSVCKVIKQAGQFDWVGRSEKIKVSRKIRGAAYSVLIDKEADHTNGALYFTNKSVQLNKKIVAKIDNHIFYR